MSGGHLYISDPDNNNPCLKSFSKGSRAVNRFAGGDGDHGRGCWVTAVLLRFGVEPLNLLFCVCSSMPTAPSS